MLRSVNLQYPSVSVLDTVPQKFHHSHSLTRTFSSTTGHIAPIFIHIYILSVSIVHSASIQAKQHQQRTKENKNHRHKRIKLSFRTRSKSTTFSFVPSAICHFFSSFHVVRQGILPASFIPIPFSSAISYFRGNQRLSVMILRIHVASDALVFTVSFVLLFYIQ